MHCGKTFTLPLDNNYSCHPSGYFLLFLVSSLIGHFFFPKVWKFPLLSLFLKFREDFLQVRVFFERLNFQEVREELSYKVITLIYFWLIEYQFIHNNNLLQHLIHYVNINVRLLIITSFSF